MRKRQFLALCYYVLSYIPFARTIVWQVCGSCCGLGQESSSAAGAGMSMSMGLGGSSLV